MRGTMLWLSLFCTLPFCTGVSYAADTCDTSTHRLITFASHCNKPVWIGYNAKTGGAISPLDNTGLSLAGRCTANSDCPSGVCDSSSSRCTCSAASQCPGEAACINNLCNSTARFCVPKIVDSATFWPRTGCTGSGTTLTCTTGQCSTGLLDCFGHGPANPVTQFEVTLNASGSANYDVSLAAGYNVETWVEPVGGSFARAGITTTGDKNRVACYAAGCTADLNTSCPVNLQVKDSNNTVTGCLDPCTRCLRSDPPAGLKCNEQVGADASGRFPDVTIKADTADSAGGSVVLTPLLMNSVAHLLVTSADGYTVDAVEGCGGTLQAGIHSVGQYSTAPLTAGCTVTAHFKKTSDQSQITTGFEFVHVAGGSPQIAVKTARAVSVGGQVMLPVQTVVHGGQALLSLIPLEGYTLEGVSGCSGELFGTVYRTGALTAACTVTAQFKPATGPTVAVEFPFSFPTYRDMYCAKDLAADLIQSSVNQGTPTAFSQPDCFPAQRSAPDQEHDYRFVVPTWPEGYAPPAGQGVCLALDAPQVSIPGFNDYRWSDQSNATAGSPVDCSTLPDGAPCGGYQTLYNKWYVGALGYSCRTVTYETTAGSSLTSHLCLPPLISGLGTAYAPRTPSDPTLTPLYAGVGGIFNRAWLTAGLQAGGGVTPYYQTFKNACAPAYTWQYDDPSGGFGCDERAVVTGGTATLTGFNVTFCRSAILPVNGACGSAAGQLFAHSPDQHLCTTGTAGPVTGDGSSWSWTCQGTNGGTSASCSAIRGYSLTVAVTGSGRVISEPAGIDCTGGSCSTLYAAGVPVTLTPLAGPGAALSGWSGDCSNSSGVCSLGMSADRSVTATFVADNVRISDRSYATLTTAYAAAAGDAVLQARALQFSELLVLNRPIVVTLRGGYDDSFGLQTGYTVLQGNLTIGSGKAVTDRIIIK